MALLLAATVPACAPDASSLGGATDGDPDAVIGQFVTYVSDNFDGTSDWWHAVRTLDGRELRLDFDTPPLAPNGAQVRLHGAMTGTRFHVESLDVLPPVQIAAAGEPPSYQAPVSPDTYALVLVDLGSGVNLTAAQAMAALDGQAATDKSFAAYYNESSYGKYQVQGSVIGPYRFSMTTCDTTGMYKAIEPMITGTYNHLIYYFNETNLCDFGGLGEEGSALQPAKRTWMNGSLNCVVLMQEPGHNIGLMHANTIKCGSDTFSTTPASSCNITEYGSSMTTMGGGCRQFNAYERWYEGWLTGCNGVRTPANGTFNLLPLESNCSDGSGVQVLQVPFPSTLTVNDPQATTMAVNLKNYYVELRTAGGLFDSFSSSRRGSGVTFDAPTVFIYASDDVHQPTTSTGRNGTTRMSQTYSVWTELLNMDPASTTFTGLTTAGQSFTDPNGGATITLESISATGATVSVSYPDGGSGSPACIDGTTLSGPGPTTCGTNSTATGGSAGSGGGNGSGGSTGSGGNNGSGGSGIPGSGGASATGGNNGSGGSNTVGSGGASATGGRSGSGGASATGGRTGSGGASATGGGTGSGGASAETGGSAPGEAGQSASGCSCSFDPAHPAGRGINLWLAMSGLAGLLIVRRPRRRV